MAARHKRNSRHAERNGRAATIRALEDLDRVERRARERADTRGRMIADSIGDGLPSEAELSVIDEALAENAANQALEEAARDGG